MSGDEVIEIKVMLGRIEEKLGALKEHVEEKLGDLKVGAGDQDARIRTLERFAWAAVGAAAVSGGAGGALASVLLGR
jgi:hypothetical protein